MSERIDLPLHPRLGRHINHDDRSRDYPLRPDTSTPLVAVRHESFCPILYQSIGACTGNAGLSAVYHAPYARAATIWPGYTPDEDSAVKLYSLATQLDTFRGTYPPNDTGSDGLSVAKALKAAGIIGTYRWAFSAATALAQLQQTPLIFGTYWYNSMSTPSRTGLMRVDRRTGMNGGHELCVDEYQPATAGQPDKVGGPNSWGTNWGANGRWYLTVTDFARLLSEQGDCVAVFA